MGQPAAKAGDKVVGIDVHIVMLPPLAIPTALPHPFAGTLDVNLSNDVLIMGKPAATVGSKAVNDPPHVPLGGGPFQIPPTNEATIVQGSTTVLINGKPAARAGDKAITCNDLAPAPVGSVVAAGTVLIG